MINFMKKNTIMIKIMKEKILTIIVNILKEIGESHNIKKLIKSKFIKFNLKILKKKLIK
jgi:hypothetical protein